MSLLPPTICRAPHSTSVARPISEGLLTLVVEPYFRSNPSTGSGIAPFRMKPRKDDLGKQYQLAGDAVLIAPVSSPIPCKQGILQGNSQFWPFQRRYRHQKPRCRSHSAGKLGRTSQPRFNVQRRGSTAFQRSGICSLSRAKAPSTILWRPEPIWNVMASRWRSIRTSTACSGSTRRMRSAAMA